MIGDGRLLEEVEDALSLQILALLAALVASGGFD